MSTFQAAVSQPAPSMKPSEPVQNSRIQLPQLSSLPAPSRGYVARCCGASRDLFAPALAGAGLHPDRVIYAEAGDEATVLAVAEDALRYRGLAGVVIEVKRFGLTPSRRLQHAAETSGVIGLVLRRWPRAGKPPSEANAATTRWQVTALPSSPLAGTTPGVGRPRWGLELVRCRGGQAPLDWIVEACDGKGRMRLVSDVADRSAAPATRRAAG